MESDVDLDRRKEATLFPVPGLSTLIELSYSLQVDLYVCDVVYS